MDIQALVASLSVHFQLLSQSAVFGHMDRGQYQKAGTLGKLVGARYDVSVDVPTVERGLREITRCSMAIAGGSPLTKSYSGLLILPKN